MSEFGMQNEASAPDFEKTNWNVSRVTTGIAGLDTLLEGGFPQGSINLISGTPGTGKTIVCFQYLNAGLQKGEKCIFYEGSR